jgi:hypothetical protein
MRRSCARWRLMFSSTSGESSSGPAAARPCLPAAAAWGRKSPGCTQRPPGQNPLQPAGAANRATRARASARAGPGWQRSATETACWAALSTTAARYIPFRPPSEALGRLNLLAQGLRSPLSPLSCSAGRSFRSTQLLIRPRAALHALAHTLAWRLRAARAIRGARPGGARHLSARGWPPRRCSSALPGLQFIHRQAAQRIGCARGPARSAR